MQIPFRVLVKSEKTVAGSPGWSEPEGIDRQVNLTAALDIGERTIQGLELVGRANINSPARNVSFSLVYHPTGNRRDAIRLARVDWRPVLPHTNLHPRSPPHLYLLDIPGTQHHAFELNWLERESRPLKWLPVAEPIIPDFQSFSALLDGVGIFFRISNIRSVPEPNWAQELF